MILGLTDLLCKHLVLGEQTCSGWPHTRCCSTPGPSLCSPLRGLCSPLARRCSDWRWWSRWGRGPRSPPPPSKSEERQSLGGASRSTARILSDACGTHPLLWFCHVFPSRQHGAALPHLHHHACGRPRPFTHRRHCDRRVRLPGRRNDLNLQWGWGSGSRCAPAPWFGLQRRRSLGVYHLLQPWRGWVILLVLQRWRLARRWGSGGGDGNPPGGEGRLLDDDLRDSGGVRRGTRGRRLGLDGAGAGARSDLRQVQDDVGGADVGDGVLFRVVVLRPGGSGGWRRGRSSGDCRSRGGGRRWRRWSRVHDFYGGLKGTDYSLYCKMTA